MEKILKRVAAIHDLSGFGHASLTAIIPVLSSMGVQVCPLPTAILSNHTGGFKSFSYVDLTDSMPEYIEKWKEIGIDFDCIYSGYLGSDRQIEIVKAFIDSFKSPDNMTVVDPVMGDHGKFYTSFDSSFVPLMRELVRKADIITPNFTEAAFLLGLDSCPERLSKGEIREWLERLAGLGPKTVVITSTPDESDGRDCSVAALDTKDGRCLKISCKYFPAEYPGTGDTFTSVMIGALLRGESLIEALSRAVNFISSCIELSCGYSYPKKYGVLLEKELGLLYSQPTEADFEVL